MFFFIQFYVHPILFSLPQHFFKNDWKLKQPKAQYFFTSKLFPSKITRTLRISTVLVQETSPHYEFKWKAIQLLFISFKMKMLSKLAFSSHKVCERSERIFFPSMRFGWLSPSAGRNGKAEMGGLCKYFHMISYSPSAVPLGFLR